MKGNFEAIIKDERPVIVDFHAVWCSPCRMQVPVLQEVADELGDKVKVIKVDVDQNSELAERYNIQSVPTLVMFKNGRLKYRQSGVHTRTQIMSILSDDL